MICVHRLDGCAPAPLAHYLKALGILRLVAEQADNGVRGWWEGDRYCLASQLTLEQLVAFFLHRYAPTPMPAPWNGASGFFKTWDEKKKALRNSKNFNAVSTIRKSTAKRWRPYRTAITLVDEVLDDIGTERDVADLSQGERKNLLIIPSDGEGRFAALHKTDDKTDIQRSLQRALHTVTFYRSAIVDVGDEKPEYPDLWGSGGNDGAMDFTARYMENLQVVLDPDNVLQSKVWLDACLGAGPVNGLLRGQAGKVGQFLPGGAGGANSVNGVGDQNDTLLNPWDFVLMLEGAVSFISHMSRQCLLDPSRAASPFVVNASGAAYASASPTEKSRYEQWMPLWSRPQSYAELRRLLAEGRAQIGTRAARLPLDVARAVKRMGTARGIHAFQRYGYIERNGQSNLAVPLGRFGAPVENSALLACIDDLDGWLRRLRREAHARGVPSRLVIAEKRLADALLAVTEHPLIPSAWQNVLVCLVDVEGIMRQGAGFDARPIPPLRTAWVAASDDGTLELRLAIAFALQARRFGAGAADPIRRHWLPLHSTSLPRFATSGVGSAAKLDVPQGVVVHGRRGVDDAIALVQRRLVEASQRGDRHLPLVAAPNAAAGRRDLASLLAGGVDLDRTLTLGRAFMALDRKSWDEHHAPALFPSDASDWPDDAWLAIRLCVLPWPLELRSGFKLDVGADPSLVRRLAAGDAESAVRIALRRLQAAGVRCTVCTATASPETARLWAAALAFPITKGTARQFLYQLDPNKE